MTEGKGILYKHYLAKTRRKYADASKQEMIENELDIVPPLCAKAYKREKLSRNSLTIGYGITFGTFFFMLGAVNPAEVGYALDFQNRQNDIDFSEIGLGVHNILAYAGIVGALGFSLYATCMQMQSNKLQRQNQCFSDLLAEKQKSQSISQNNESKSDDNTLVNQIKKHYYNKEMVKIKQKFQNYTAEEMSKLQEKFVDDNLRKIYKNKASIEKSVMRALISLAIGVGYNLGCTEGYYNFRKLLYSPGGEDTLANIIAGALGVIVLEPFKIAGMCSRFSATKYRNKAEAYTDIMQEKSIKPKENEVVQFRYL